MDRALLGMVAFAGFFLDIFARPSSEVVTPVYTDKVRCIRSRGPQTVRL